MRPAYAVMSALLLCLTVLIVALAARPSSTGCDANTAAPCKDLWVFADTGELVSSADVPSRCDASGNWPPGSVGPGHCTPSPAIVGRDPRVRPHWDPTVGVGYYTSHTFG